MQLVLFFMKVERVKDFLVDTLSFWVPQMSPEVQDTVYLAAPELRGKNYMQLVGAHSPVDILSDEQTHAILSALTKTHPYVAKIATFYMDKFELQEARERSARALNPKSPV